MTTDPVTDLIYRWRRAQAYANSLLLRILRALLRQKPHIIK
jgi:hypothetical protein